MKLQFISVDFFFYHFKTNIILLLRLTQIVTTILGDRALNKVGHITKGAKASSGVSTFANAVKLAKELKTTFEMLQSFKRNASYAFSSVGGTFVTKIPQGELIEAYYKFAKSKDGKTTEPYDIVPYRPSNSPLENHHGVMDVWAKHNVPDYVSRGANTPSFN